MRRKIDPSGRPARRYRFALGLPVRDLGRRHGAARGRSIQRPGAPSCAGLVPQAAGRGSRAQAACPVRLCPIGERLHFTAGLCVPPARRREKTRKGNRSPQRHGGASAGRRRGEKHLPKAVGQAFAWAAPALREKKNRRTGQSVFGRGGKWTGPICCGAEGVPDGPAAGVGAPGMARKRRAGGRAGPFALLGAEPFCCRF